MNFTYADLPELVRHHQWLLLVWTLLFLTAIFAVWPMRKANSVVRKLALFGMTFLIVILPPPIFALSGFLQPDSKAKAHFGWLDCWQAGKLALTPLMIWAVAALYRHDLFPKRIPTPRWILLGLALGSLVSGASILHFAFYVLSRFDFHDLPRLSRMGSAGIVGFAIFSIPTYVFVWYTARAIQTWRAASVRVREIAGHTILGSVFWISTIPLSRMFYNRLPDNPPGCFVVTAASRGHRRIVGPLGLIQRGGIARYANPQLLAFWNLEHVWQQRAPASHRSFRRLYNIIGPVLASRIRNPWLADLTYIALKPLELFARIVCLRFQRLEKYAAETSSDWKGGA